MKRRSFFKSISLLPISLLSQRDKKLNEKLENVLEYTTLRISFPFENAEEKHSLKIYNQALKLITNLEQEEVMIHCEHRDAELYDRDIDALLCSLDIDTISDLWYPSLELLHRDKILDLPTMSLIVKIRYPQVLLKFNNHSISCSIKNLSRYINKPPCRLDKLSIEVEGDFIYNDIARINKKFDLYTGSFQ